MRHGKTGPDRVVGGRRYHDTTGRCLPACLACEHCDGERGSYVRNDYLRGYVCPDCDSSLDEMLGEGAAA